MRYIRTLLIIIPFPPKHIYSIYSGKLFRGKRYNNQERPNISHGKVLATCVAILGAQPNAIRLINEMLNMTVNRDYIRAKNRAAHNIKSHQLEQQFATTLVGGTFHYTVLNKGLAQYFPPVHSLSKQKRAMRRGM